MLELRQVTLAVAGRTLCRNLSVRFEPGQNWVILGANGSGKTTLLHTLAGLRAPENGEVYLEGQPLAAMPQRRRARRVGVLLQDYETGLPATALEVALTGRHPHLDRWQWEDESDRDIARSALASLGLDGFEQRALATLSGGERRRVEIAALLTQDAPLCLLDEPTNHLDLQHQMQVLTLLAARTRQPGHLNVMVLHDINLAARFGSHVILMYGDGSVQAGPLAEILTRAHLERLYCCELRILEDGGHRWYMPV